MSETTIPLEGVSGMRRKNNELVISIRHNREKTVFVVLISRQCYPIEKGTALLVVGDIYKRTTPFLIHDITSSDPEYRLFNHTFATEITLIYPLKIVAGPGFVAPSDDCERFMKSWDFLNNIKIKFPSVSQSTRSVITDDKIVASTHNICESNLNLNCLIKSDVLAFNCGSHDETVLEVTRIVIDNKNGVLGFFNHNSCKENLLFAVVFPQFGMGSKGMNRKLPFVCVNQKLSPINQGSVQMGFNDGDPFIGSFFEEFIYVGKHGNITVTETKLVVNQYQYVEIIKPDLDNEGAER